MPRLYKLFSILALFTGLQASAHTPSDGIIHATLGTHLYTPHSIGVDANTTVKPGFALLVEADLDHNGGAELLIQRLQEIYSIERGSQSLVERANRLHITLGYRHWWSDRYSTALGFFSSYSMGDAYAIKGSLEAQDVPQTSAHDPTNYGVDFSLQAEPWRQGRYSAIIDARYSLPLTLQEGEASGHYGLIVGLKYFVQSRERPVDEVL